jgi:hypothetical protein
LPTASKGPSASRSAKDGDEVALAAGFDTQQAFGETVFDVIEQEPPRLRQGNRYRP